MITGFSSRNSATLIRAGLLTVVLLGLVDPAIAQQGVAALMSWKGSDEPLHTVTSESGNLYGDLSNHGPAIENPWAGYRLYFRGSAGIDVLSKKDPGLVLDERGWHQHRPGQSIDGDAYHVGLSTGLGGVRLWDGNKAQALDPVKQRTATVHQNGVMAQIDMLSKGIPFQDHTVDLLFRLTTFADQREAVVDVFILAGGPVPLAFGLSEYAGFASATGEGYIANWGRHKDGEEMPHIGAGLIFPPETAVDHQQIKDERLVITPPVQHLRYQLITGASLETADGLDSREKFFDHVKELAQNMSKRKAASAPGEDTNK